MSLVKVPMPFVCPAEIVFCEIVKPKRGSCLLVIQVAVYQETWVHLLWASGRSNGINHQSEQDVFSVVLTCFDIPSSVSGNRMIIIIKVLITQLKNHASSDLDPGEEITGGVFTKKVLRVLRDNLKHGDSRIECYYEELVDVLRTSEARKVYTGFGTSLFRVQGTSSLGDANKESFLYFPSSNYGSFEFPGPTVDLCVARWSVTGEHSVPTRDTPWPGWCEVPHILGDDGQQ